MPYYEDLDLLFIHIPKTGGNHLSKYLRTKSKEKWWNVENYVFRRKVYGNTVLPDKQARKISMQHQTYNTLYKYRDLLKIPFNNKLKIISIVRNPYERIISDLFWYNLIKTSFSPEKIYNVMRSYIDREYYDNHNIPQYKFITDENENIINNIVIFRTYNLTKQLHLYGFKDYKGPPLKQDKNTYYKFLNRDSIGLINEFYKKDFELFNFPMIRL